MKAPMTNTLMWETPRSAFRAARTAKPSCFGKFKFRAITHGCGGRNKPVTPVPAHLAFHTAFFVAARRVTLSSVKSLGDRRRHETKDYGNDPTFQGRIALLVRNAQA
jgi:hypothetical protein